MLRGWTKGTRSTSKKKKVRNSIFDRGTLAVYCCLRAKLCNALSQSICRLFHRHLLLVCWSSTVMDRRRDLHSRERDPPSAGWPEGEGTKPCLLVLSPSPWRQGIIITTNIAPNFDRAFTKVAGRATKTTVNNSPKWRSGFSRFRRWRCV
jgi:hypothetical protein